MPVTMSKSTRIRALGASEWWKLGVLAHAGVQPRAEGQL
jgi:hypothetical protein